MRRIRTNARYCARWASKVSPTESPTMRSSLLVRGEEDDVPDVGDGVDDASGQLRLGLAVDRAKAGDPAPERSGDHHVDRQPGSQDRREGRLRPEEQHQEQPALGRQRQVVPVGALEQGDRLLGEQHRPMGDLAGQHVVEVGRAVALGVGEDQLAGAGQHRDAAGVGAVPDAPLEHDEGGHHHEELNSGALTTPRRPAREDRRGPRCRRSASWRRTAGPRAPAATAPSASSRGQSPAGPGRTARTGERWNAGARPATSAAGRAASEDGWGSTEAERMRRVV